MSQDREWQQMRPVLIQLLNENLERIYVDPVRAKSLFLRAIDEPLLERRLMAVREIEKLATR